MNVPEIVVDLLAGPPEVDVEEQAFPFLTVDDRGFPHVCLLSRAELEVSQSSAEILACVYSPTTKSNLLRDGRACLVCVDGEAAHYVKLSVERTVDRDGLLGCVLGVMHHKVDAIGIPLQGMSFPTSEQLAENERWLASARLLEQLASA